MAKDPTAILIVDDDEDILIALKLLLGRHYETVDICANPESIPQLLNKKHYAAVLLDMNFGPGESSGNQGMYWLQQIMQLDPDAVVVLITAHGGVDMAVEAMKLGATDFVSKPWQNEKLLATLSASVKLRRSRNEARQLKAALGAEAAPMLGTSPAMREVLSLIERSAPTSANVLILGENGTGKELAARALHNQSERANEVFMSVDLGAVPESLFESELFGHVKGAFTDAREDRVGRIQAANGGTLFLDEIGNLPLHLQAKLLSVLEQRQVFPVGSTRPSAIDVRVIAATNLPREQLNDESRFRQDLLFRLNTVEIELPPLRERRDDIALIARHYADFYARKYQQAPREFSPQALSALQDYRWPGNIRALRHSIERAVILSTGEQFEAEDFGLDSTTVAPTPYETKATAGVDQEVGDPTDKDLNLETIEREAIRAALTRNRYNISHAAKALGLTRAALYRRMEKHGL
jgi:DNA-binding NtrC family response regulator